jgi:hypothetical protein
MLLNCGSGHVSGTGSPSVSVRRGADLKKINGDTAVSELLYSGTPAQK